MFGWTPGEVGLIVGGIAMAVIALCIVKDTFFPDF